MISDKALFFNEILRILHFPGDGFENGYKFERETDGNRFRRMAGLSFRYPANQILMMAFTLGISCEANG